MGMTSGILGRLNSKASQTSKKNLTRGRLINRAMTNMERRIINVKLELSADSDSDNNIEICLK